MQIRPIQPKDNPAIAAIIRESLEAVHLNIEGTAYFDPHLDQLSEYYTSHTESEYWVAEEAGRLVGGVGIGPFDSVKGICELQKLYVSEAARGKGLAHSLMETALAFAASRYTYCYLETHHSLEAAAALYQKYDFELLPAPLPGSEHSAMDAWYLKKLKA